MILDYLLKAVKRDIQAECLASIFYCEDQCSREINKPFPDTYFDEYSKSYNTQTDEQISIGLSEGFFLVVPWKRQSMVNHIKNIFYNDFKTSANQDAFYYPYIDLCYVCGGRHSTACGIYYEKGKINAYLCDIISLFQHISTDGVNWYNSHTNQVLKSVPDFRISIIYEVAKLKYQIEQEITKKEGVLLEYN